ncbi:hypothetical protein [Streptomyces naphthomycinicus]|uniref:hypothetical protein n=1 Tax=Streptomyces naphthomycinicus TaxID=2872625 RepID=UPI001CECF144|nr:hypothetical protein [Streptomyces sp. TML10]
MHIRNHRVRRVCAAARTAPPLVVGGAVTTSAAAATTAPVSVGRAVQQSSPGEILSLVNAERAEAGCGPLKFAVSWR